MIRGAELDAHKRGITPTQREFDGYAHRRGRAAAVWRSAVGFRLSRPLRRVLARARQPLLGRHLRGDRLPAAARGFAAQGLVPDGWHRGRRHIGRGADRMRSAGPDRLSRVPGAVGRCLRFRRHCVRQLRVLRGGARRLYRRDHRCRHPRRGRRRECGGVFMLAVTRASEISIGIVCAGVVLAGTDFGGAQRGLAASFATLAAEITDGFIRMMELTGPELPDTQPNRRELVRHVIALDPVIDQALGESTHVRHHAPTLQTAVYGLFRALEGWRGAAMHVSRSPDEVDRQGTETILRSIPPELRSARESDSPVRWMADPMALRHVCEMAVRRLVALPAGTPSLRLLADETAKVLAGMSQLLDGLALLVDAPGRPRPSNRGFRLGVPDWLPALVNAGRAFVAIGAVELFWIGTAWPNGASTIVFVATVLLLLSPRGDLAYGGAIAFTVGTAGAVLCAAMIKFAVLPALQTFPAFCVAIGLVLVPAGFAMAQNWQPAALAVFTATGANFVPLLAPTNQMSYDTAQFYNTALAVIAGCGAAALSFGVLPSLSAAVRTRRLLALALRDLRRLAVDPLSRKSANWEARMYGRLRALPDDAEPLQRAQLLAALSASSEIAQLRRLCLLLGLGPDLDAALTAVAQGNSTTARAGLARLDRQLASLPEAEAEPGSKLALRVRAKVLVLSDVLAQHAAYFDAGGPHEIH